MAKRPVPATKTAELVAALAALAEEENLNEFRLKQLEREAEKLLKIDAVAGHTLLGAVASLRGDVEGVHSHHRAAVRLSGDAPQPLHNYGASLAKLGQFTETLEVARQAHSRAPADPEMFAAVVTASLYAGYFREARDLVNQWNAANPERAQPPDLAMEALLSAVDRELFTEDGLQEVLAIVHEVLRSSKTRTVRLELHVDEHDPDSFLFEWFLLATPDKAEELNEVLDAQILDCPHLMEDPGLRFMPAFLGASVDGRQSEAAT